MTNYYIDALPFGKLYLDYTILYYDMPLIFIARDEKRRLYLCYIADDNSNTKEMTFFVTGINFNDYFHLKKDEIVSYRFRRLMKKGPTYLVKLDYTHMRAVEPTKMISGEPFDYFYNRYYK